MIKRCMGTTQPLVETTISHMHFTLHPRPQKAQSEKRPLHETRPRSHGGGGGGRHQQEHRPQRPTERSDPTQHAKGRTGDCPGPRKETTTRRNVTQGGEEQQRSTLKQWLLAVERRRFKLRTIASALPESNGGWPVPNSRCRPPTSCVVMLCQCCRQKRSGHVASRKGRS